MSHYDRTLVSAKTIVHDDIAAKMIIVVHFEHHSVNGFVFKLVICYWR